MSTATAVRERPILFSSPMVRAILAGAKSMTRRVVNEQPRITTNTDASWYDASGDLWRDARQYARDCCPYGDVGTRLWVRETFNALIDPGADDADVKREVWNAEEGETEYWVVDYQADGPHTRIMDQTGRRRWQPSIHMPRWASRITLEITDVRVERVAEISEADAKAEGIVECDIPPDDYGPWRIGYMVGPDDGKTSLDISPVDSFRELWRTIHKSDGPHGWEANPFVWVIAFRRIVQ